MTEKPSGVVAGRQILDLSASRTVEDLAHITALRDIAMIIVPRSLAADLERIPQESVALVVTVPDDVRVRVYTGMVQMAGESLSHPGAEQEFLVVMGALIFTTPVSEATIGGIAVMGGVLAPSDSDSSLGSALSQVLGAVDHYKYVAGQQFRSFSGQMTLGSVALENADGNPADILIASGQIMVAGTVEKLGYQQLIINGQAILPRDSRDVISSALTVSGQVMWYGGSTPRLFMDHESLGRQFFELIEDPLTLIVIGSLDIEADVPAELFREKVAEICVFGRVRAAKAVLPVVQYLAVEKTGNISELKDSAGGAA